MSEYRTMKTMYLLNGGLTENTHPGRIFTQSQSISGMLLSISTDHMHKSYTVYNEPKMVICIVCIA